MTGLSKPSDPSMSRKIRRHTLLCAGVGFGVAMIVGLSCLYVASKVHEKKQEEMIKEFLQSMKK